MHRYSLTKWNCYEEKWLFIRHNPYPVFPKLSSKILTGEVILTKAYIINRLPTKVLGNRTLYATPLLVYPNVRTINNLTPQVYDFPVFVHVPNHNKSKLDPHAIVCF